MKKTVIFILTVTLLGCSSKINLDQPSAALIRDGKALMENGKHSKAAPAFENAVYNAENPEEAQLAQRLLGDAYYGAKKYLDAIAAYEVYYDIYYDDPNLPEVIYRLGKSYSRISLHPKRDQTNTHRALEYFEELLIVHPSQYEMLGAKDDRQAMIDKLAVHEYEVASYYVRTKSPESAVTRLVYLLNNYPDSAKVEEASVLLVKASMNIKGREDITASYIQEFETLYPANEDLQKLKTKFERRKN